MEKLGEALDAASNTREGDVKQTEGAARPSGCELGTNQEHFPRQERGRGLSVAPGKARQPRDMLAAKMFGGAEGNRTLDLLNAIQALSQLSYGPMRKDWKDAGTKVGNRLEKVNRRR